MDKLDRLFFDLDEWQEYAKVLTRRAWPLCPAVADESDGWSYSRVVKSFGVPSSLIVRGSHGWLVFATRSALIKFVRDSRFADLPKE